MLRAALPPSVAARADRPAALTEALLASLHFSAFHDARRALRAARAARRADGRRQQLGRLAGTRCSSDRARSPLLDGVVTSAEAGARKPSPAIFEHALELARVTRRARASTSATASRRTSAGRARPGSTRSCCIASAAPRVAAPPGVTTIASLAELAP